MTADVAAGKFVAHLQSLCCEQATVKEPSPKIHPNEIFFPGVD